MGDLELTWSVTTTGPDLRVEYEVANHGERPAWLLDEVLVFGARAGVERAPQRMIVRPGADGVARLVRGYSPPLGQARVELPPGARRLDPGARVTGSAVVPLPLVTWHPNEITPRPVAADRVVLEVGVLDSDDTLAPRPLGDGTEILAPSPPPSARAQRLLRGPSLSLSPGA